MDVQQIDLGKIKIKDNYRLAVSEQDVSQLMGSIKAVGLLEPVIVKKLKSGKYELTAGFRRYNAVKKLGFKNIAANIYKGEASNTLINLTENLLRENSTAYEVGRGIWHLKEKEGMKNNEVAMKLGLGVAKVRQYIDLFSDVPKKYRGLVKKGISNGKRIAGVIPNDTAHKILLLRKTGAINASQTNKLFEMAKKDDKFSNGKISVLAKALKHDIPFEQAAILINESHSIHFNANISVKDLKKITKKYGSINQAFIEASKKFLKISII